MAKVLVYEDAEGVKVVVPVIQPGQTEARALELAALPILGRAPVAVDRSAIPQERDYRAAWTLNGTAVVEDVAKARTVALARCRAWRDAKLKDTDSEKARLDDLGTAQEVQAFKAKRQALRDLPAAVQTALNAASTMAQLRAVDLTGGL